jgi:2-amino-4-hydroxy-6-hydroxymethyldihydropteridine diphosphokinase
MMTGEDEDPWPVPVPESKSPASLAIALGGNVGDPEFTLGAVRPLLESTLLAWWSPLPTAPKCLPHLRWSPLFRTEAVGGPVGQPPFVNAVLLAQPLPEGRWDPFDLLGRLQELESRFGRQRRERWGPRTLDLDLLWCGDSRLSTADLQLPHPLLRERSFVLAPLAAINADLAVPGPDPRTPPMASGTLLKALLPRLAEAPPERLPPCPGWPE